MLRVPSWQLAVALSLVALSASAGLRGLWMGVADISPSGTDRHDARLVASFRDDAQYVFGGANWPTWPWEREGTKLSLTPDNTVTAVFDRHCGSTVHDLDAFRRLIANTKDSKDGVITYCYDNAARTVTFVLFDSVGGERVRVVTKPSGDTKASPSLSREQRRAVLRALGVFIGPFNP